MQASTKRRNPKVSPFSDLPISKVFANPDQPRKSFENMDELASSIERHGLIHPIAVVKKDESYMIISGERRFRAVKELGHESIKAHVMDVDDFSIQELTLVENVQRSDLTPFEVAMYVNALSYRYETAAELATSLGKPPSYISKCKSVLKLSEWIKENLAEHNHDISFEVLQELGRVKDVLVQERLYMTEATREEIREVCREEKEGTKSMAPAHKEIEKVSPAKEEVHKEIHEKEEPKSEAAEVEKAEEVSPIEKEEKEELKDETTEVKKVSPEKETIKKEVSFGKADFKDIQADLKEGIIFHPYRDFFTLTGLKRFKMYRITIEEI